MPLGAAQAQAPGGSPGAPTSQRLSPDQLDTLLAPIALYPDALVDTGAMLPRKDLR
jgi:hypothetical protein